MVGGAAGGALTLLGVDAAGLTPRFLLLGLFGRLESMCILRA